MSLMTTGFYRAKVRHAALAFVWLARGAAAVAICVACGSETVGNPPDAVAAVRVSQTQRRMGVPWTITVYAKSAADGHVAIAAGFAEVTRLERILSDYDPLSELSQLSAQSPTSSPKPLSDDLWRVLSRAVEVRDATGGAFDPTVGPLTSLWRQSRKSGRLPVPEKLAAAREAVGPQTLLLVPDGRGAMLTRPAMRLDLGGIGMGYAVDRAMEVLNREGITSAMVDASGDIAVTAPPPGTEGWRIAVAPLLRAGNGDAPREEGDHLLLVHAAVTTSGDAFQAVDIDGRRYSHIVDPRTGMGIAGPAAVTVIASDCATADAVATAASVLGPLEAAAVLEGMPGCAARFVSMEAGQFRHSQTPRWPSQASLSPH
jgi:thiamine biosynthesis lipoprotein